MHVRMQCGDVVLHSIKQALETFEKLGLSLLSCFVHFLSIFCFFWDIAKFTRGVCVCVCVCVVCVCVRA